MLTVEDTIDEIFAAACANIHFHAFWFLVCAKKWKATWYFYWNRLAEWYSLELSLFSIFEMVKTLIAFCVNDEWYDIKMKKERKNAWEQETEKSNELKSMWGREASLDCVFIQQLNSRNMSTEWLEKLSVYA